MSQKHFILVSKVFLQEKNLISFQVKNGKMPNKTYISGFPLKVRKSGHPGLPFHMATTGMCWGAVAPWHGAVACLQFSLGPSHPIFHPVFELQHLRFRVQPFIQHQVPSDCSICI